MKKHLLLLFAALLPLVASAEKVEIGGIGYNLTAETREAEVTFKGNDPFQSMWYSGSITIPATVTYDGVAYSVTWIGDDAFMNCISLTAITIPESVTSIGKHAFSNCRSLTAITLPEGVTSIGNSAFYSCISLTDITIPEGVTSIGDSAFDGCSSLTAITIPGGVTSIGERAFYGCSGLTAIVVAKGNKVYDSRGDCNAIIETNSNTLIQGCATTIIPEGVTSIGSAAFGGCSSLTAITIPESVTSIGIAAFSNCRSLTAITIPEGVTSIGSSAFSSCSSLTAITIPEGVTNIGDRAFFGCRSLTAIVVAKGNKVYDSRGDCNAIIETNSNTLIKGCATTIIPEGVTSIGVYAFDNCRSLTSITIPEGVTRIGNGAFYGCNNLTAITLPESVTIIGDWAFDSCTSLTAITIPEGVTSIGDWVFFYCTSLTDVYCHAATVPSTNTDAFDDSNIENATLHVPASAMDEYKNTAPWSSFGTIKAIEKGDADGILTIPAKPVLIQCQGGVITLSGLDEGTEVAVYTASGTLVDTATATDGTATLTTDLTAGTIAIVKTGDYSIKVAIK